MRKNSKAGRLGLIERLAGPSKCDSLSVGSKDIRLASINLDLDKKCRPDIVADACHLPFKAESFSQVFFTNVIEHLPKNHESVALNEIFAALMRGGVLVFSTASAKLIFLALDPAWYLLGHRHYRMVTILQLMTNAGFTIKFKITLGYIWELLGVFWYSTVTYPMKRLLKLNLRYAPDFISSRTDREYTKRYGDVGYHIIIKAVKLR